MSDIGASQWGVAIARTSRICRILGAGCLLVHEGAVLSVRRACVGPPPRDVRALRLCQRLALDAPGGTAGGLEREGPGAAHRALTLALSSGGAAALAAALDAAASADAAALRDAQ